VLSPKTNKVPGPPFFTRNQVSLVFTAWKTGPFLQRGGRALPAPAKKKQTTTASGGATEGLSHTKEKKRDRVARPRPSRAAYAFSPWVSGENPLFLFPFSSSSGDKSTIYSLFFFWLEETGVGFGASAPRFNLWFARGGNNSITFLPPLFFCGELDGKSFFTSPSFSG